MPRILINRIDLIDFHLASVEGCYNDPNTGLYGAISLPGISYDITSSTSVRQQLQDGIVAKFNADYATTYPPVIASDIEYLV